MTGISKLKLIHRNKDVITNSKDMEKLHTIKNFPILMNCVNNGIDDDIFTDLIWEINKKSGVIQLKTLIPLEILYKEQHSGTTGKLWLKHHKEFSEFIYKYDPKSVLEIGGGHGILSTNYKEKIEIPWTIVEPSPNPVEGCTATFIKSLFDENFTCNLDFDTIIHSHVFEHIYEPIVFVKHLSKMLCDGKKLIFSLPNLTEMLKRKQTNCINFEHTVFLTETYVDYLLNKFKFKIVEKKYFENSHSIFYSTVKDETIKPTKLNTNLYIENKKIYNEYVKYHKILIKDLNDKMEITENPIYLFGAHIFSQYLINNGLEMSKICGILDNDINKQGKRLYGTNLKVMSTNELKNIKTPIVILKTGFYNDEIKEDIVNNINKNTIFL
jgi:2-polyprenyl-3-methyl-5-hydroxy-6-metoxy-1,4-benzoquinol methylase